jgi:hypothetical protein
MESRQSNVKQPLLMLSTHNSLMLNVLVETSSKQPLLAVMSPATAKSLSTPGATIGFID